MHLVQIGIDTLLRGLVSRPPGGWGGVEKVSRFGSSSIFGSNQGGRLLGGREPGAPMCAAGLGQPKLGARCAAVQHQSASRAIIDSATGPDAPMTGLSAFAHLH